MYCSVQQCPYSSRNDRLFWLHMKRNHPIQHINAAEMSSDDDQDKIPGDTPDDDKLSVQDRQDFLAAKFSISLETEHKLSQQGTDDVIHSTKLLFDETFSLFKTKLAEKMRTRGITTDILDDVSNPDVLCHLSSQSSRNAFYSSRMNLIKPRDVLLYREFTLRKGVKNHLGYFIPFAENLKSFLSLPEIWREIGNSHKSRDKYMHDICDGGFVQNSEIFNAHPHALQIRLYTDDIEIVNPIGSHTSKHRLSMFYFTLANISPQYRSTLSAIQLLAVAKTRDPKANCDSLHKLLKDFIITVNKLETTGIEFDLFGSQHVIFGSVVCVPCDSLPSSWLGGFKESPAFAYKGCRTCKASNTGMKLASLDSVQLWNEREHRQRCMLLEQLSTQAENTGARCGASINVAPSSISLISLCALPWCMTLCTFSWKELSHMNYV